MRLLRKPLYCTAMMFSDGQYADSVKLMKAEQSHPRPRHNKAAEIQL